MQRVLVKRTGRLRAYRNWQHGEDSWPSAGDTVDERFADYFLEVLPPVCMTGGLIQIGEPSDHRGANGAPRFATIQKVGRAWVYTGDQERGVTCEVK